MEKKATIILGVMASVLLIIYIFLNVFSFSNTPVNQPKEKKQSMENKMICTKTTDKVIRHMSYFNDEEQWERNDYAGKDEETITIKYSSLGEIESLEYKIKEIYQNSNDYEYNKKDFQNHNVEATYEDSSKTITRVVFINSNIKWVLNYKDSIIGNGYECQG